MRRSDIPGDMPCHLLVGISLYTASGVPMKAAGRATRRSQEDGLRPRRLDTGAHKQENDAESRTGIPANDGRKAGNSAPTRQPNPAEPNRARGQTGFQRDTARRLLRCGLTRHGGASE